MMKPKIILVLTICTFVSYIISGVIMYHNLTEKYTLVPKEGKVKSNVTNP